MELKKERRGSSQKGHHFTPSIFILYSHTHNTYTYITELLIPTDHNYKRLQNIMFMHSMILWCSSNTYWTSLEHLWDEKKPGTHVVGNIETMDLFCEEVHNKFVIWAIWAPEFLLFLLEEGNGYLIREKQRVVVWMVLG